jgi:multidrug resistance protein MdtO
MASIVQGMPQVSRPLTWVRDFLKEELAPYPGRPALVARMTIAATVVMIINMTFRIPYGAYGALYALTISRENPDTTVKAVKTIIIAFALSVLYILLGAMFFLQNPALRLVWVIGTLFVMFFALSSMTNYTAAARFGYLLIVTIPVWDQQIPTELKVEGTLWAFAAISLASVITVMVELVYAELRPSDFILQPLAERLCTVADLLDSYAAGAYGDNKTIRELTRSAMVGTSGPRRLLRRSGHSPQYREQIGAVIAHVARLVDIAASMTLSTFELTDHDKNRIRNLASNIRAIRSELLHGAVLSHIELDVIEPPAAALPLLAEMEETVSSIGEIFAGQRPLTAYAPSTESGPTVGLFLPDAFSNPEHIKFGLKGCLAASLCYLFYNAKAWPGINTAITTCFLTALSTIGSSHQKQVLRIAGAIVGGIVMGIGAQVFILPGLDSVAGFTLLFIAFTIIAAWFATSSSRLSYFGVQVAIAFYLINLSEFQIQTSLIPARDRVIGILLGLLMMWLVFDQLWGSPARIQMKKTFISNLRLLARFAREPVPKDLRAAVERSYSFREEINSNFDKVRGLADAVFLEFGPHREQDLIARKRIRDLQPNLRMIFITRLVLWKYRARLPGFELPEAIEPAQEEFDNRFAKALEGMADRAEGNESTQKQDLSKAYAQLEQAACNGSPKPQNQFLPQIGSFLLLSRRIALLTDSLEKNI